MPWHLKCPLITGMLNRQASARFTFLLTMAAVACAANLAYLDLGTRGTACCMVPDGLGNVYVVGSAAGESGTAISVTRLDAANHVVGSFRFGGSADEPRAAVLDPMGNLLVAGQTRSSDFPLIHPLITQTEPGAPAGFIAKVNPSNGQILFSTLIGGVAAEQFVRLGTTVNAVATDLAGNIYAGGVTNARDFPVSANAFQKTGAGGDTFGPRPFGFVLKLSPDGARLLYSTLLGGLTANCFGGSHCVGINASTTVNAVAVDRNGVATVAGATNAPDFPATAGVVQTVCRCLESANNGFVTRLNAAGSGLAWSTILGGTWYGFSQVPFGVNSISAVALDSAGNVTVAGKTDADDFPITAGVLQPKLAGPPTSGRRPSDGFVSRLNSTGTALLFSTYLGGSAADQINGLQLDTAGNVWLTGPTNSSDFPGTPAPFTGSFFAEISSNGTRLLASQRTPTGATGQSILAGADIRVLGATGSVIRVPGGEVSGVAVLGIVSSAGGSVKGYIAPGEFVSLYGNSLGPDPGVGATLDSQGRISSQLGGTRVLFDGIPAPLLYASSGQINALVPYGITGGSVVTQVTNAAGNTTGVNLYFRPAQPEVFNRGGAALALNQDGSVNSAENPAAPGSIITIFASGAGLSFNQQPDGSISQVPVTRPIQPLAVLFNDRSLEVVYAGNAPGLVINTLQVNFRLPQQPGAGEFQLMTGGFSSSRFTISVE
jgi:uncharacterized protein (TIGR03437 family)